MEIDPQNQYLWNLDLDLTMDMNITLEQEKVYRLTRSREGWRVRGDQILVFFITVLVKFNRRKIRALNTKMGWKLLTKKN